MCMTQASLAAGETAVVGLLVSPGTVNAPIVLLLHLSLFMGIILMLIVVWKPTRRDNRTPINATPHSGIGHVSSARHVNNEYGHQHMYVMTHPVYGLHHNGMPRSAPQSSPDSGASAAQTVQVPGETASGVSLGGPQQDRHAVGLHPQRRQPSSVTMRAFIHRSQR
jgi:hypothetical protein